MKATDIAIRPVRDRDIPTLYAHQADPVAHRMAGFTPRDREAFETHWRKILADPTCDAQAVLADGALVGHVVAFERGGVREVGYWIAREAWGRGIASRALALFLAAHATRPLYAVVTPTNVGSLRVLDRCGFEEPTAAERSAIDTAGLEQEERIELRILR